MYVYAYNTNLSLNYIQFNIYVYFSVKLCDPRGQQIT